MPQHELETLTAFVEGTLGYAIESVEVEGFLSERWASDPARAASRRIREINITCKNRNKPLRIGYDTKTGVIGSYISRNEDPECAQSLGYERAFSAESAFRSTIPILQYYGLSTRLADYCRVFQDSIQLNQALEGDLYGAEWRFYRVLSHEGMPCRGSKISLYVSAADGRLSHFHYAPVIPPEPCEFRISQDQAVNIAEEWFPTAGMDERHVYADDVKQVVAAPGFFSDPHGKITVTFDRPTKSFYCWEVPFKYYSDSFLMY
ncbi:MAG: hypothetical protein U9Q79_06615, partial [Candidatus Hydrogenedentes bacterium]|nr:hypothetical protein [Candidatus Hydrogenedentota bacterium]